MRFLTCCRSFCISSSPCCAGQRTTCTIAPGASAWSQQASWPGTPSSSPSCCSSAPLRWCWPPSRSSTAASAASAAFARGSRDLLLCQEAGTWRRHHPRVYLGQWQVPWRGYGTSCDTSPVQDRFPHGGKRPQPARDVEAMCVGSACKGLPPCRALCPGGMSSSTLEQMPHLWAGSHGGL